MRVETKKEFDCLMSAANRFQSNDDYHQASIILCDICKLLLHEISYLETEKEVK